MPGPSYRTHRPILVRAPLHHALPIPPLPDLRDAGAASAAARRTWLEEVWALDDLAEAVRHASPSLGDTVDALAGDPDAGGEAVLQAVRSLAGYVLRAANRPAPFGLFAGVTEGAFGDRARADWGTGHSAVASAGARWLADVVDRLAADPEVRTLVSVVANNGARLSGSRLVVPWRRRRQGEEDTGVRYASVRHTEVVRALLAVTARPVPYQEAVGKAAATSELSTAARATAVMACGTGKRRVPGESALRLAGTRREGFSADALAAIRPQDAARLRERAAGR